MLGTGDTNAAGVQERSLNFLDSSRDLGHEVVQSLLGADAEGQEGKGRSKDVHILYVPGIYPYLRQGLLRGQTQHRDKDKLGNKALKTSQKFKRRAVTVWELPSPRAESLTATPSRLGTRSAVWRPALLMCLPDKAFVIA